MQQDRNVTALFKQSSEGNKEKLSLLNLSWELQIQMLASVPEHKGSFSVFTNTY